MAKESHYPRSMLASLALIAAMSAPSRVFAQSPAASAERADVMQAEAYAARAFEAYNRKEYAAAVALYQMAHEAAPSADALFNIARIYDLGLRDRPLAIAAYRRLLSDPGATPERIQLANERLEQLREAELALIERRPPWTGDEPRPAPPSPAARAAADPKGPPRGWSASRVAALASGAAGLVSLGVGIGFGVSVLADAETANSSCVDNRCSSRDAVSAARAAARNATLATVGVSAGAALLGLGTLLWFGAFSGSEPAAVGVEPIASASELGLSVSGGW